MKPLPVILLYNTVNNSLFVLKKNFWFQVMGISSHLLWSLSWIVDSGSLMICRGQCWPCSGLYMRTLTLSLPRCGGRQPAWLSYLLLLSQSPLLYHCLSFFSAFYLHHFTSFLTPLLFPCASSPLFFSSLLYIFSFPILFFSNVYLSAPLLFTFFNSSSFPIILCLFL